MACLPKQVIPVLNRKNILVALARERKERMKVRTKVKSPGVTRTPGLGSLMDQCATMFCLFVSSGYIWLLCCFFGSCYFGLSHVCLGVMWSVCFYLCWLICLCFSIGGLCACLGFLFLCFAFISIYIHMYQANQLK